MTSFEALHDRVRLEADERRSLAPWGMPSADSEGRRIHEERDPFRTEFQRDRDRVIHTTAFRRLIGKTQVFVSSTGDHFRTRLTHSLEVSQVARSVARSLGANPELTEAVALAHDLGHAPFGHPGGDVLDELMAAHGGFEHNHQSLRILDVLEQRYPDFDGLNLTYEVRECIVKHKRPFEGPAYAPYRPEEAPLLEAQIVDMADGIAYNSHDLDDGIHAGILDPEGLKDTKLWSDVRASVLDRWPSLAGRDLVRRIVAGVIDHLVKDLVRTTAANLEAQGIRNLSDVRRASVPLVTLSPAVARAEAELKAYLFEHFYTHHRVARMRHRARVFVSALFEAYVKTPILLPTRFRDLAATDGIHRAVADYISGMTDAYASEQYAKLFRPEAPGL